MKIAMIVIGVLLLVILVLLIPIRYRFSFEKWKAQVTVKAFFGLFKKEVSFPGEKEEETDDYEDEGMEEEEVREMNAYLEEMEHDAREREAEKEQETLEASRNAPAREDDARAEEAEIVREEPIDLSKETKEVSKDDSEEETEESEKIKKKTPSYLAQFLFALDNGLIKKVLIAAAKVLAHSFPGSWRVKGAFGTGDPMSTGVACGIVKAFLPGPFEDVEWNFTDKVFTLKGEGDGRIIPLYVVYILLTLAVARETREFWHFRRGGKVNG